MWLAGTRRGGYTRLAGRCRSLLIEEGQHDEALEPIGSSELGRVPSARYDFVELFSGGAELSHRFAAAGARVGPPVDLQHSWWWDLGSTRCVEYVLWLIVERRVSLVWMGPPPWPASGAAEQPRRRPPSDA